MFSLLLTLALLAMLLHHFFIWKPLDTSVLYQKHAYLLFGHRGTPECEPENTMPSFERAIADGCNAIELDVYRTTDGHLIVFHDDTLERTTNGTGRVADHTLAELQELNAAHHWPGREERIPTLKTVIDTLPNDIIFNFEIKNFSFFSEQRTELELVRFIRENNLRDRVILSSFNPLNIWRVKMSDPKIFTALLWYNPSMLSLRHPIGVHLSHPDLFHPFEENVNWGVQFWSRVKRIPMHVWVVNDAEGMKKFARNPMIKGIMSDNAKLLVDTLGDELL
ncbi:glycerophosphodiester phosphodiesterase [bacterium]|nr:glycerophosphodiester phosphodiesterase [bacterium]